MYLYKLDVYVSLDIPILVLYAQFTDLYLTFMKINI